MYMLSYSKTLYSAVSVLLKQEIKPVTRAKFPRVLNNITFMLNRNAMHQKKQNVAFMK